MEVWLSLSRGLKWSLLCVAGMVALGISCGSPGDPVPDAGVAHDAGTGDAGLADAGLDAGSEDAGVEDAGVEDAGAEDAGAEDAGAEDAGAEDAGAEDAGADDAGGDDAGIDAGADAGCTLELCDGLDNDCNGMVDDLGMTTCGMGDCQRTVIACLNGVTQSCTPGTPRTETCDGRDDDCDGQVDEGTYGNCGSSIGACMPGMQVCQNGALSCMGAVGPTTELCDGRDNDCDGMTDEGNPGGGAPCSTGLPGVCGTGSRQCLNGQLECAPVTMSSAERCDGLDNNCNGMTDEGNPDGGVSCNTGLAGVCAAGAAQCANGAVRCVQSVQPAAEVCDGLDNNCDGQADEGNPGGGVSCAVDGGIGACSTGTRQCQSAQLRCVPPTGCP